MKLKLNPTQRVAILLTLCALGAIWVNWANFSAKLLMHLASTLGFGMILFCVFKFISKKQKNFWNAIISCLILFLTLNFALESKEIILTLIAIFITIFSKFYIEPRGMPIINPVVLGLLTTVIIAKIIPGLDSIFISWWGASYKLALTSNFSINVPMILMLLWIIGGLNQWRKLPLLISFFIFHAISIILIEIMVSNSEFWSFLKFTFTTGTIYFFAAIMLIEPKTSPMLKSQQIFYALVAAIIYNLLRYFEIANFDLLAIATANLYFFMFKLIKLKKTAPTKLPSLKSL